VTKKITNISCLIYVCIIVYNNSNKNARNGIKITGEINGGVLGIREAIKKVKIFKFCAIWIKLLRNDVVAINGSWSIFITLTTQENSFFCNLYFSS